MGCLEMSTLKRVWSLGAAVLVALALPAAAAPYVTVPGGTLVSALARDGDPGAVAVAPFAMRETLVTQDEFARFAAAHPQWQKGQVPLVFAEPSYLQGSEQASPRSAVVQVSWFAAQAYCESEGARLPTWSEWEYVAAADASRRDARGDPAWLARILRWYARPATAPVPDVGGEANAYGLRDLHGLVWEWVDDFNALLVDADSRSGDDPDKLKFCGAGAINLQDRMNYAVLMRIALLSSLSARSGTSSLGFRCVKELP